MTDILMQAYYILTTQSEIPDVKVYAEQLEQLGNIFADNARPSMAETCRSKAQQYKQLAILIPSIRRVPLSKSFVMLEEYEPNQQKAHWLGE